MIVVRRAHPRDWRGAAEVNVRSWQFTYRGVMPDPFLDALVPHEFAAWRERFYRNPPPHGMGLVAARDGVLGYCDIGRARSPDPTVTGEVYAIYVDPPHIGTGIGARLIAAAHARMAGLGHRAAELWVLDSNERARSFYERSGWRSTGDSKTEHIGGVEIDEVRYVRDLRGV